LEFQQSAADPESRRRLCDDANGRVAGQGEGLAETVETVETSKRPRRRWLRRAARWTKAAWPG
jgi:hypothetical protein